MLCFWVTNVLVQWDFFSERRKYNSTVTQWTSGLIGSYMIVGSIGWTDGTGAIGCDHNIVDVITGIGPDDVVAVVVDADVSVVVVVLRGISVVIRGLRVGLPLTGLRVTSLDLFSQSSLQWPQPPLLYIKY